MERQAVSDRLFEELGRPAGGPIVIALQEVQIRYWLDERFIVRSLDGRVDPVLLEHVSRGNIDHIGYIKQRNVQYLLETPNYNRDRTLWSLERLNSLGPGATLTYAGLTFSRLTGQSTIFRIEQSSPKT